MKTFDSSRYYRTKTGGLYLKYSDIEEITKDILLDYDKTLLTEPHAIEYDDFLEGYLGVDIDYQHIYTPRAEDVILGCTLFTKQYLNVFNKEKMIKESYLYIHITVVLDRSLVDGVRKIQDNITGLHEGGHVWLHKDQFTEIQGQYSLNFSKGKICCRKADIEKVNMDNYKPSNDEKWREWQANVFAVTLALPKQSLEITVRALFDRYGVDKQLVMDADYGALELAYDTIPKQLKKIYNMSKEAITYRLIKLGYYITKEQYVERNRYVQMSLF